MSPDEAGPPSGREPDLAPAGRATRAQRDPYITRPTRWTVFLRTFVPWQMWRFVRINLKMVGIIRRRA